MATLGTALTRAFVGHMTAKANQPARAREWTWETAFIGLFKGVMHLLGFGALTYAGYTINITVAFVVGGISCFIFSWLFAPDKSKENVSPVIRR